MKQLPRSTASHRFTAEVVRSLRIPQPRRAWLRVAASLATLVLVAGLWTASLHRHRRVQLDALRAEHERIESDLRQLKSTAEEVSPFVVLQNGNNRIIVDTRTRTHPPTLDYD